jgi:hypothetical protein
MTGRRLKIFGGGLAALLAIIGISVAIASGDSAAPGASSSPNSKAVGDAKAEFAALAGSGVEPSRLGPDLAEKASSVTGGLPFTAYPVADEGDYKYFVLETGKGLCTFEVDGNVDGGGCTDDVEAFTRGGVDYTFLGDKGYRITALLPNGTGALSITNPDGSNDKLVAANNLVTAVVKTLPSRAEWTLADGSKHVRDLAPFDTNEEPRSQTVQDVSKVAAP